MKLCVNIPGMDLDNGNLQERFSFQNFIEKQIENKIVLIIAEIKTGKKEKQNAKYD